MAKTDTEVVIGGKVFTLSGAESEEYLQKVATYLNGKIAEINKAPGYAKQPPDMQVTLLELNIADDYFKMKDAVETAEQQTEEKEKELYDLKHELIATQIKLENTEKNVRALQDEINESAKKILELEAQVRAAGRLKN